MHVHHAVVRRHVVHGDDGGDGAVKGVNIRSQKVSKRPNQGFQDLRDPPDLTIDQIEGPGDPQICWIPRPPGSGDDPFWTPFWTPSGYGL